MQDQLETLANDMKDLAAWKNDEDLEDFAERLEKIIRKNF